MCDTMVALGPATAAGSVIFGKNSDREFDEAQYLTVIPAARHPSGSRIKLTYVTIDQVPETYAVLLSKPHWIWGAEIGANQHGLVAGNEALFSRMEASAEPGIIGMDYLRLVLERARDVNEAVLVLTDLLRQHGQSGYCGFRRPLTYHNSFLLADASSAKGGETVDREWVVKKVESQLAISNAMSIGERFEQSSDAVVSKAVIEGFHNPGESFSFKQAYADRSREPSGRFRMQRANALLANCAPRLTVSDFFRILRDHQEGEPLPGRATGPRLCAHTRESPLGQTTASWVSSINPHLTIHWVTGTAAACTGVFKPVVLQAGLPAHGVIPGPDPDPRSLWWRHERLHCALDAAMPALRADYLDARDALERRFITTLETGPSASNEESLHTLRELTECCWRQALQFENDWLGLLETAIASKGTG
jgi:secernin